MDRQTETPWQERLRSHVTAEPAASLQWRRREVLLGALAVTLSAIGCRRHSKRYEVIYYYIPF